ncbi:hypothetical protein N0V83_003617 [Neocucurbitaria cava]|uniref:F-box domain-containing protein n=1 Tax=Neocucurbitaria cava TaxID=798079 RepID=A0A9W8YBG5_9PLEO|nr:hypothetical protein N0V83_003617 [Neocucurbitaria cava]
MASLLTTPLELLVAISSYLPTSDLTSLRLTCKQIERSLYEWFSQEFFTKKQFMLTHSSLQALIDISKHVSFSKKLSHVIIATNAYDEIPLRFRDSEAATRYIQGYEDQKVLLSTGIDREMLTEAFQGLVNLDTIGIRDFSATSRDRDGDHASWNSWGATTVHRETGIQLQFSEGGNHSHDSRTGFAARIFLTVLYALGKANRTPSHFEMLLRKHHLPDSTFCLPEFLRPTADPVLQNVKTLLLNVNLDLRYFHTEGSGTSADPHAGRSLGRFLGSTPNLTHLRLNFLKHLKANNEAFLKWLGEPILSHRPQPSPLPFLKPPPITLSSLRVLELGQINITPISLLTAVIKFALTLEGLSLWRMSLYPSTPSTHDDKPNLWATFFKTLSGLPQLKLKHLKVGMLQQDHMYVHFAPPADSQSIVSPHKQKEYTGREMEKFLKELQEQVTVEWPTPIGMNDDADEDEDEDDDDNSMDDDDDEDMLDDDE